MITLCFCLSGQLDGLELRLADETRLLGKLNYIPTIAINSFPDLDSGYNELRKEGLIAYEWNVPPFYEEWRFRHINFLRTRLFDAAWHRRLTQEAFSTVKGIYGVSESALTRFESIYGNFFPKKINLQVIHNFVDTKRFAPSQSKRLKTRQELNIPLDAPLIGAIGRLDIQKNTHYVLDCFIRIRQVIPNCYLLFVGSGNMETEIKNRVKNENMVPFVRFLGFHNNVEDTIPAMDLHMLLSFNEGFGIVTVEAMSCGIPVIGTEVPGTADILRGSNGGTLVPLDNAQTVADNAVHILQSPGKYRRMSEAAVQEADRHFSKDIWERNITNFYNKALEKS